MRKHMTPIRSRHEVIVDTCGTGGMVQIFNISTAAALVTAAAGVPVAKHGNRAVTSRTGSADVLAALGVNISADLACVERCLEELGICFCFAPLMHPSMKHVAAVRNQLGFRTIFNLLGPLCNPAGAPFQLLGVGRPELRETLAGARIAWHQTLVGRSRRRRTGRNHDRRRNRRDGGGLRHVREHRWTAADFGLTAVEELNDLEIGDAAQSAASFAEY